MRRAWNNALRCAAHLFQLGQQASPLAIGLRDHSMRTPGQLQQNYPRELAFSEAAAAAGVDAEESWWPDVKVVPRQIRDLLRIRR